MSGEKARKPRQQDGVLILDKPVGPTSAACLARIKRELGQKKIGHAGTLDPMAGGVLIVLLGQATKIASFLTGQDKAYVGEMILGKTTDTYDSEGTVTSESEVTSTADDVRREINFWMDLTEQEVPAYSAAKHKGKPLYSLARAGEEVPVKIKAVTIHSAEPLDIEPPRAGFRVRCSPGTYVRSLVHSLGMRLGCGAVMTALTREASGPFGLEEAHGLEETLADPGGFAAKVIPLADALPHWPKHLLTEPLAGLVKNGARLPVNERPEDMLAGKAGDRAMFLDPQGAPLALVEAKEVDGQLKWAITRGLWR